MMQILKGHNFPVIAAMFLITCGFVSLYRRIGVAQYYRMLVEEAIVDCNPDIPCIYPETVDFRVIVITYNRPHSLLKLLRSLDAVEMDGDSARMEIWVDRSAKETFDDITLIVAQSFKWSKGPVRVHVQKKHVGIYGQWIDTWSPRGPSSSELAVIFEDDISVSPYIYRWLKAAHRHYGPRNDYVGATLTSDQQVALDGSGRGLTAPKNHTAFLSKCFGTWGMAPHPRQWLRFQKWYHLEARPNKTFHPYVPGILPTVWYKGFEASGDANSMWSMWLLYFTYKEHLYTAYNNLPKYNGDRKSCLCINRREKGLHNSYKGAEDLCELLSHWKNEYVVFPNESVTLDWNGLPKVGY